MAGEWHLVSFDDGLECWVPREVLDDAPDDADDRWFLVVLVTPDGHADGALSRRTPDAAGEPFSGPWGLLTKAEAQDLAVAWTLDPSEPQTAGTTAQVVEVFRYDGDPVWTEA